MEIKRDRNLYAITATTEIKKEDLLAHLSDKELLNELNLRCFARKNRSGESVKTLKFSPFYARVCEMLLRGTVNG